MARTPAHREAPMSLLSTMGVHSRNALSTLPDSSDFMYITVWWVIQLVRASHKSEKAFICRGRSAGSTSSSVSRSDPINNSMTASSSSSSSLSLSFSNCPSRLSSSKMSCFPINISSCFCRSSSCSSLRLGSLVSYWSWVMTEKLILASTSFVSGVILSGFSGRLWPAAFIKSSRLSIIRGSFLLLMLFSEPFVSSSLSFLLFVVALFGIIGAIPGKYPSIDVEFAAVAASLRRKAFLLAAAMEGSRSTTMSLQMKEDFLGLDFAASGMLSLLTMVLGGTESADTTTAPGDDCFPWVSGAPMATTELLLEYLGVLRMLAGLLFGWLVGFW
mmetsp:Transcript_19034/g.47284  ORF Transcript_19034/g.47284 Transcript_19034/m.47284 type:complete len:330 (+) Transcript_19034:382-1371(+)